VPGSKTDYTEGNLLKAVFQGTAFPVPSGLYVALFNGLTSQANRDANNSTHTATEVVGNAYARVNLAPSTGNWPLTGTGPTTCRNGVVVNFTTPTASWGTIYAFGIYDGLTVGNQLYWGDMVGPAQVAYCSQASPGLFSAPAHGLAANNQVRVWNPNNMGFGALPGGVSDETIYYVGTVPTPDTFTLSTTASNGSPVNTSTSGVAMFALDQSQVVNAGNTVQFAVNGITVTED
jgi:hypothetical protein